MFLRFLRFFLEIKGRESFLLQSEPLSVLPLPSRLLVVWCLVHLARPPAGNPSGGLHGFASSADLHHDCSAGDWAARHKNTQEEKEQRIISMNMIEPEGKNDTIK